MNNISKKPLEELTVEYGERPRLPPLPGATEAHRRHGRRLAAIHRMYLADIARIGALIDHIDEGRATANVLATEVRNLDITQNYRMFGTLCGQECRVLGFHHDAEEHGIFPQLEAQGHSAISALVARLRTEHEVVHELLERLEGAATALMSEPSDASFNEARAVFRQLEAVIRSHFGYEETELEEALGLYVPHI